RPAPARPPVADQCSFKRQISASPHVAATAVWTPSGKIPQVCNHLFRYALKIARAPARGSCLIHVAEHLIHYRLDVLIVEPPALRHADEAAAGNLRIELLQARSLFKRELAGGVGGIVLAVHLIEGAVGHF